MLNFFESVLLEAEGDSIPDIPEEPSVDNIPPDVADDVPDIPDDQIIDDPPDVDTDYNDINIDDNMSDEETVEDLNINEKISVVMNSNLYQKFLSLIVVISDHISIIKDHRDEIYSIAPNAIGIEESLKKLRENINLYLANNFINNNYSSNLLFFNKCSNLLNLLDNDFSNNIKNSR